ncbi:MAG: hypothetical protein J2P17_00080 [Mycobacterium sp.]|nr:hypothetical protein [Mycobacterium sp.]
MTVLESPSRETYALPPLIQSDNSSDLAVDLARIIFGGRRGCERASRMRAVVAALNDSPGTGTTQADEARTSYVLLSSVIAALGGSARTVASADGEAYALFDWAAMLAPHLLPVLSGHLLLSTAAIEELGDGNDFQQSCLEKLDTVGAVGVVMVTELGHGTDAIHMETTATWQPRTRTFRLDSPTAASVKFMPNVASDRVGKLVVVVARLIVEGRDAGVWPFLMPLRTDEGLVDGVDVMALPDNGFGLWMDNAITRFQGAQVPESGLLAGQVARFDDDGRFHCALTLSQRFSRTMSPMHGARLCMAGAAVAAARAGLALTIRYAARRSIRPGTTVLSSDHVVRHLVYAMADVWAMTCLVNLARARCDRSEADPDQIALWGMLIKPVASQAALEALAVCRQRCAAQGMLRANYLVDYISLVEGIVTAEGENWAMLGAAGRVLKRSGAPSVSEAGTPASRSLWHSLLSQRERLLLTGAEVWGHPDCAAVDLATAVAQRIALDAMLDAADSANNTAAHQILIDLAELYALKQVRADSLWFAANDLLPANSAARIDAELHSLRDDLAPHLPVLARSFALSDDMNAPIAADPVDWWMRFTNWANSFRRSTPPRGPVQRAGTARRP